MFLIRHVLKQNHSGYSSVFSYSRNKLHRLHCQSFIPLTKRNLQFKTTFDYRIFSTKPVINGKPLSAAEKLKAAVKDYGCTVIVFHVTISLISLGCFYLAVYSGFDMVALLRYLNMDFGRQTSALAGASTFVVAYSVHKLFAPIRISITLAVTPFLVRYFRKVGIIKPPKQNK